MTTFLAQNGLFWLATWTRQLRWASGSSPGLGRGDSPAGVAGQRLYG